jgi:HEAT repeat protein
VRRHASHLRVACALVAALGTVLAIDGASSVLARSPPPASAAAIVEQLRALPLPRMLITGRGESNPRDKRRLPALEIRRQRIYDELHAFGPRAVPALARALRDPDVHMRRNVAVALDVLGGGWWQFPSGSSKIDLRPALAALVSALSDSDPMVRAWAAEDIGDMGHEAQAALPALRRKLSDPSPAVRAMARRAIARVRRPRVL